MSMSKKFMLRRSQKFLLQLSIIFRIVIKERSVINSSRLQTGKDEFFEISFTFAQTISIKFYLFNEFSIFLNMLE